MHFVAAQPDNCETVLKEFLIFAKEAIVGQFGESPSGSLYLMTKGGLGRLGGIFVDYRGESHFGGNPSALKQKIHNITS